MAYTMHRQQLQASHSSCSSSSQRRSSCVGARVLQDAGSICSHRPSTSGRAPFVPQAVLTTSTARLPATHLESSVKALEQLKTSTINREWIELPSAL